MAEDNKPEEFAHEQEDAGSFLYTKKEIGSNDETQSIRAKIAQEAIDSWLTEKSLDRQEECWCFGCKARPTVWVREIQFDMLGDKAGINQHIVSTRDYDGPVPGFCMAHVASGPTQIAECVYWDRTEISLGLRPRKWWVIFTDGTKQGGLCEVLNPNDLKPSTTDLHIKS